MMQMLSYVGQAAPLAEKFEDLANFYVGIWGSAVIGELFMGRAAAMSHAAGQEGPVLFQEVRSLGASGNKLRNVLTRLANQGITSSGRQGSMALRRMATKAGLEVVEGGNHLRVLDGAGNLVTTIPHSIHSPHTAKSIASAILHAAGF